MFIKIRHVQEVHLATVVETLQSIKQSDMSPMLSRIYESEGGPESLDVLMKYLSAFLKPLFFPWPVPLTVPSSPYTVSISFVIQGTLLTGTFSFI